jgi:hypothetical protein
MRYITKGFQPASPISNLGLVYMDQAAVSIEQGDAIFSDGSGYATNVGTAFAATFLGVAHVASDNSAGSDGDVKIGYTPAQARQQYWVKCSTTTAVAATHTGLTIDLDANDAVDPGDTTCLYYGFVVTKVDVSTAAVAANTQGFVKGYFVNTADES